METLIESKTTLISASTQIEGNITFDQVARFHGVLRGQLRGTPQSKIILCESSLVEGDIFAHELWVNGFVQGNIQADGKVVISSTGRVIGNIQCPSIQLEFGSYFEGHCQMSPQPENSSIARSEVETLRVAVPAEI